MATTASTDDDGYRDPQVDDALGDGEIDRPELRDLDDGLEDELLGHREVGLLAARDEEQADDDAERHDGRDDALSRLFTSAPSSPGGRSDLREQQDGEQRHEREDAGEESVAASRPADQAAADDDVAGPPRRRRWPPRPGACRRDARGRWRLDRAPGRSTRPAPSAAIDALPPGASATPAAQPGCSR